MVVIGGFGRELYGWVKVVGLLQEGLEIVPTMTPYIYNIYMQIQSMHVEIHNFMRTAF